VWGLFALAFVPLAIYMLVGIVGYCGETTSLGQQLLGAASLSLTVKEDSS
jgi:hypothetical protein